MKCLLTRLRKTASVAALSMAATGSMIPQTSHATGIPVIDVAAIAQLIVDQISQNAQLAESVSQTLQMYTDYSLQLQNLTQLPGSVRAEIQNRLQSQIANNINDFGVSYLSSVSTMDPNSANYYNQLEGTYNTAMNGRVPRTMSSLNTDLTSVGLGTGTSTPIGQSAFQDRVQWERVMDDTRQVALTRKNAEQRASQAQSIAQQMKNLPSNNTVGAVQLLAGQQTLAYAQNEDLLKNQAALLRVEQERQTRLLAEREEMRQLELNRLNRAKAATYPTSSILD
jgi:hypothetical protein